ncbi:O-antigen ligase family protein [Wenxinia marina]|uniref:Lipid A core-O-antigen ligase n=1 Tax=Wenxinia marina DSM 24838 TaxID=1123501 RepID=A0A0D0Q450_9RHOB|nr:O-antigen ligase family protein [Wenxinia marina]KIQ69294.1 Lipid A core - O-antigen ligase [Wenxinia marina DSM 24838]
MRVDKKRILNPDCNAWYVVPAIALSLFVFAYSTRLGQVSILLFYSVWFGPLMFAPWLLLRRPWPVLALLGVSALFVASVIWSEAPSTTLRSSIQYGTTVACALIAARMTSVPNLALGGSIGGLFIMIYSMINGGYSYDFIDGTYAFTGAFASKNQLGYQATLAIIFSLSLIGLFRAPRPVVIFAVITTVISARLMFLSDSATSLLTAGAALATFFLARIIVALAPMQRRAAVTLLVSGALATAITAYRAGAFDAVLAAFGKDATLTGRTYLWNQAIEIGGARPILGLGYNAFWVAGRPDAERLWDEFYITGRTGFRLPQSSGSVLRRPRPSGARRDICDLRASSGLAHAGARCGQSEWFGRPVCRACPTFSSQVGV